jgi:hypothetical protein
MCVCIRGCVCEYLGGVDYVGVCDRGYVLRREQGYYVDTFIVV